MDHIDAHSAVSTSSSSSKYDTPDDNISEQRLLCDAKEEYPLNDYLFDGINQESAQRSLLLCRQTFETSFGFALQSYVFKRTSSNSYERITYVDYVSADSPADRCGITRGIQSFNSAFPANYCNFRRHGHCCQ